MKLSINNGNTLLSLTVSHLHSWDLVSLPFQHCPDHIQWKNLLNHGKEYSINVLFLILVSGVICMLLQYQFQFIITLVNTRYKITPTFKSLIINTKKFKIKSLKCHKFSIKN